MSPARPRGLVAVLLQLAVRRWPAALRAEQRQEWLAELAALHDEPRSTRRRLAFVVSLAAAPPPQEAGVLRDWRERAPGLALAVGRPLGYLMAGVLATLVAAIGAGAGDAPDVRLRLGVAFGAAAVGLVLGQRSRLPFLRRRRGRWPAALGLAGLVTTAIGVGHLAYRLGAMAVRGGGWLDDYEVFRASVASISFVVLLAPLLTIVVGLAATGRRLIAVAVAAAGLAAALVAADHADIWPFFRQRVEGDLSVYEYTYGLFNPLVVLAAAVVAYAVGLGLRQPAGRRRPPADPPLATSSPRSPRRPPAT